MTSHIKFVLDRSGSMGSSVNDAIEGYNTFLADQKKAALSEKKRVLWTLVLFDHEYTVVYDSVPVASVPLLNESSYVPRGSTALYDAIGKTAERPAPGESVICVILTDGEENASNEYNNESIKSLIERKQSTEKWEFVFLGAGQDAVLEASKIGIRSSNAMSFSSECMQQCFTNASAAVQRNQRGQSFGFTANERVTSLAPATRTYTSTSSISHIPSSISRPSKPNPFLKKTTTTTTTTIVPNTRPVTRSNNIFRPNARSYIPSSMNTADITADIASRGGNNPHAGAPKPKTSSWW